MVEQNRNFFKQVVVMQHKAHHKWFKQGNLNTKFFHYVVKWRRVRNRVNGVFVSGQWWNNKEVVKDKVSDFFKSRFVKSEGVLMRLDNVNFNSINGEDNNMLVGLFSEEEVKSTV